MYASDPGVGILDTQRRGRADGYLSLLRMRESNGSNLQGRPSSTDPYHAISIDASYSCHRSALLSIFANQKVINSDHLSGEPVSYKLQKSMGCSDF